MQNSVISIRISSLYGSLTSSVVFCMQNSHFRTKNYKSLWVQDPTCGFCMQNSGFWTRITSLYGSQTWPVFLCKYNSVISTRITRLYGFQPSSVVLWIQNSDLMTTIVCVYGFQTSPAILACKTAWLASELLVFMGPSPHALSLDAKQRLLDRINKSLWVPGITCRFVNAKQRA